MTTSTEHAVDLGLLRRIGEAVGLDWAAAMAEVESDQADLYGLVHLIDDIQGHVAGELTELRRAAQQEAEQFDHQVHLAAARQVIDDFIAGGKLIRLANGSLIEAERFDPAVHTPAAVAEARRQETARILAGETPEIEAIAEAESTANLARIEAAWLAAPGSACPGCGAPRKRESDEEFGSIELCLNPDCTYDK